MSNRTVNRLIVACLLVIATSAGLVVPALAYSNGGWTWYPAGNFGWRDAVAWMWEEGGRAFCDVFDGPDEVIAKSKWRSVGMRSTSKPVSDPNQPGVSDQD